MRADPIKIAKISVGAVAAAAVSYALGLQYAVSAGIICLLTIQDTRKETLKITLKRLGAFCGGAVLSFAVFCIFGF